MQLLTEIVPGLKRLGTFIDKDMLESCREEMDLMEKSAQRLGLTIVRIPVKAESLGIEDAVKRAVAAKVQALMTAPMTTNLDITDRLAAQATRYGLPFMHDVPQLAGEGLAVYGPDFEDIFRRAGHYVARILKGEKPALMAIEEPKQFRLIVNAGVARRLGLTVPQAVLLRADEVIP
jgi:putative ABC transport system substrate-binding protein